MLNDALPPEFQLSLAGTTDERHFQREGDVFVELVPQYQIAASCGESALACATGRTIGRDRTYTSKLILPDDLVTSSSSQYTLPREIIVHEMLHTLGIWGHVDSIEFPDSLMGTHGDYFPNLGYTIHRLDREILQIMYMSQNTQDYNDYGEWSDTTLHIAARADDDSFHFGTAWFNGLPQPWARGITPLRPIADSWLRGRATWNGAFVGFSGPTPLAGDVQLEVNPGHDGSQPARLVLSETFTTSAGTKKQAQVTAGFLTGNL